jgi:hypothetical protein
MNAAALDTAAYNDHLGPRCGSSRVAQGTRPAVMHRPPPRLRQPAAQGAGQPDPIGQHPQQCRADMRHHIRPVRGDRRSFDHAAGCTSEVPPSQWTVDVAITSSRCSRGTSACLHTDERRSLTVTMDHGG